MKIKDKAKAAVPPVEAGTYLALCIGVVDLGVQETAFNGKTRYTPQVQFIFELPTEMIEVDGQQQPRWLSRRFSVSASKKGNLRRFIETWLGKTFSDDAFADFDLFSLLHKPAMLTVALSEDGQYANIASAVALLKGMQPPEAISAPISFDVDEWDQDAFEKLPEYLQELIQKSTQFREAHLPQDEISVETAEQTAAAAADTDSGGVPF